MRLVLALLVLAGLLVLADRVAVGYAERRLAGELQQAQGLAERPEVAIAGFPFVTQALAGEYREVTVEAAGVALGDGLRAERVEAVLDGASVPLRDVLRGAPSRLPVQRLETRTLLAFDDLQQRAAPDAAEIVELSAGPADDQVRVEALVTVLGQDLTLVSDSRVDVDGDRLRVTTGELRVEGEEGGTGSALVDALSGNELDFEVDVGALPSGVRLTDVQVTQEGLVAVAGGEDLVLEPTG